MHASAIEPAAGQETSPAPASRVLVPGEFVEQGESRAGGLMEDGGIGEGGGRPFAAASEFADDEQADGVVGTEVVAESEDQKAGFAGTGVLRSERAKPGGGHDWRSCRTRWRRWS